MPWPAVLNLNNGTFRIEATGAAEAPVRLAGPMLMHASMRSDGVTRTFRLPYGIAE